MYELIIFLQRCICVYVRIKDMFVFRYKHIYRCVYTYIIDVPAFTEFTGLYGMEGTSRFIESNPPAKQIPYSRLHRQASRWVLNSS